jgi:molybdate transport system ATP-binding protein
VTFLPRGRRRIGLVLRNYGLLTHSTVERNVAFGSNRHGRSSRRPEVAQLVSCFHIDHPADQAPQDSSPGEKQRTALARAAGDAE